jgi:hypothetical protein
MRADEEDSRHGQTSAHDGVSVEGIEMRFIRSIIILSLSIPIASADDGYFQQYVRYQIKVDLEPKTSRLTGTEAISYYNNSPDTLREIYFHLFYNAFQPGSYMDRQAQERWDYDIASAPPEDLGYVKIEVLKNDGERVNDYVIDNTIMRVPLTRPLAPGDSTFFYIEFSSQIPAEGARAARAGKHFDVGQWYPKPAVYDARGWHANQYLEAGEFYGEYADFDIELTLPDEFIVGHCGILTNEEEIYGGKLPEPPDDSILIDALKYVRADTTIPDSGRIYSIRPAAAMDSSFQIQETEKLKTWKFRASNIHDFAFCADPKFKVDVCKLDSIRIMTYYTDETAGHWAGKAADYARKALEFYSQEYFQWPFDHYSVVYSAVSGGMEYPDMTMVSGKYSAGNPFDHGLESTIAHEVGHSWFYGILGFNEGQEAFLDEGLTSFATVEYMEHYYGRFENNFAYPKEWQRRLLPNGNERNDEQKRYIGKALTGTEEPMATPADQFRDYWTYYIASYHKASSVYFMLRSVMGDKKFESLIRGFFHRWAFKHPCLADLWQDAEQSYGDDLDWFFKQWFYKTWTLDYAVESARSEWASVDGVPGYRTTIGIKNNGRCVMPLDVAIYFESAPADTTRIPVIVWQKGATSFDTTIFFRSEPMKVTIDPGQELADINRLNNSTGLTPVSFQFMVPQFIYPRNYIEYYTASYVIAHNPLLWFNRVDGIKPGYKFDGAYLEYLKRLELEISVGLKSGNFSYGFQYGEALPEFDRRTSYYIGSKEVEGRGRQELGLQFRTFNMDAPRATQAEISIKRNYIYDPEYLFEKNWSAGSAVTVDLGLLRKHSYRFGEIVLNGSLSNATFGSDYNFRRAAAGLAIFVSGIGVGETHLYIKAGRADGNVPQQIRFSLSTADAYETWDSPLYRSRGTLPDEWIEDGHLFKVGGAGLSGYIDRNRSGTRLFSARISNDLPRVGLPFNIPHLSKQIRKIRPEIYFGGGRVWNPGDFDDDFLFEAGLVLEYDIPRLGLLIPENNLSFHMPLWVSDPGEGEDEIKWRWLFSLSR